MMRRWLTAIERKLGTPLVPPLYFSLEDNTRLSKRRHVLLIHALHQNAPLALLVEGYIPLPDTLALLPFTLEQQHESWLLFQQATYEQPCSCPAQAQRRLGERFRDHGRRAEAMQWFRYALANGDTAHAALELGKLYYSSPHVKLRQCAAAMLGRVLQHHADTAMAGEAHHFLGRIAKDAHEYPKAVEHLELAVATARSSDRVRPRTYAASLVLLADLYGHSAYQCADPERLRSLYTLMAREHVHTGTALFGLAQMGVCTLCLDTHGRNVITTPCGHVFHYDCLVTWFASGLRQRQADGERAASSVWQCPHCSRPAYQPVAGPLYS